MKRKLLKTTGLLSCAILISGSAMGQINFVNRNTLLHSQTGVVGSNTGTRSGNTVLVTDVNFDGFDDIVKLDNNRYLRIEYQQAGGTFTHQDIGDFGANDNIWGASMADVDHNGYKDFLYGGWGTGGARVMKLNATGTGMLGTILYLPGGGGVASQNVNYMDVNNDGWEDIFVCNDVDESMLWLNDGAGNFPAEAANSVINFNVTPGTSSTPDEYDESGNYGSVWTDFDNDGDVDFYIAHCRQNYGPGDLRRTDVLFENNGSGVFTSNAAAHGLGSNDQDWTSSFGDIDNDGDFDLFLTKHDVTSKYYINDGDGDYTTAPSYTIAYGSMPMQSQFEDLDNDGFVDIIITGDGSQRIYRNNGNLTFTNMTTTNTSLTVGSETILSFASGDLNHDGKIDLYTSYGSTYNDPSGSQDDIYWQNSTSNSNHFLTLNMVASLSNKSALGARAYIYGSWGVQTREVRAGESYGTLNSSQLHFGLGAATVIDSVVVNWPAGGHTVLVSPAIDQFLNVLETNPCTLSGASVTAGGPLTICSSGGSVTLTANATGTGSGYSYLWTNGATTQAITINTAGNYAVTITESAQCHSTSTNITVVVDPNETPTIAATADTVFCEGDSVLLSSTAASSYLWSNGATTQSTYASQAGNYTVQIQGLCQQWTSNVISVNTNPAPAPVGTDVTLTTVPSTTTVTATGNDIIWYANPTGGAPLGTGPSYATGMITSDTVFYAQDSYQYGGGIAAGGKIYHVNGAFSGSNFNEYMQFTALENTVLKTVKVYTDQAGTRAIELRNATGTVLQTATVNIPVDSSVVTLNFNVTAGTTYRLGTNGTQNNTTFGSVAPRLRRNNSNVAYPYAVVNGTDTVATITTSSQGNALYYYFYDWKFESPAVICTSPRTPVNVTLDTSSIGLTKTMLNNGIRIYPNPASDFITVSLQSPKNAQATVVIYDLLGKEVYNETYSAANAKTISTQGLKGGVYEMSVSVDGKVYHARFVVQ
jgi:hypothetical protein